MAEKEERILIARSTDYTIADTDKGELFEGKIAPHCANVFTRAEAIDKMAKAFFKSWYGEGFEQEHPDLKRRYRESAEAALNALLEGK